MMNMSNTAILFAATIGLYPVMLGGCGLRWSGPAGPYKENPATVTDDPLSRVIRYTGPPQYAGDPGNIFLNYQLRGFKERKTGALGNQLYMHTEYAGDDWVFFD